MQIQQLTRILLILLTCVSCKVWNVLDYGVIESDPSLPTCNANTKIVNILLNTMLQPNDTLLIPYSYHFWFNGGIFASSIQSITIQIDGAIHFQYDREHWPTLNDTDHVLGAMRIADSKDIRITSSYQTQKGMINGHGAHWWGAEQYCIHKENRPKLLRICNTTDIVIEYIFFKDSPKWTVHLEDVKNVEVHHVNISAKRDENKDDHDLLELTAFNTDGFDVSGENVWIHDVDIWTNDDCIAVKPMNRGGYQTNCSQHMLFERITASGLGLTIGSIAARENHSCINNITFRDAHMYKTWKGIYMKSFNGHTEPGVIASGMISNVLYENIVMDKPAQVPIWIGPQQAIYPGECSLLWPYDPWAKCPVSPLVSVRNITLRNITINSPRQSPGLLLGSPSNPMKNITFDNVVVNHPGLWPWGTDYYKCEGVEDFHTKGGTQPAPQCNAHSVMDVHGVEVSTTWLQNLEGIPGLHKYLGLIQCLKLNQIQNDLMLSTEPETPASFKGQEYDIYQNIQHHRGIHSSKKTAVTALSLEQSVELLQNMVLWACVILFIWCLYDLCDIYMRKANVPKTGPSRRSKRLQNKHKEHQNMDDTPKDMPPKKRRRH